MSEKQIKTLSYSDVKQEIEIRRLYTDNLTPQDILNVLLTMQLLNRLHGEYIIDNISAKNAEFNKKLENLQSFIEEGKSLKDIKHYLLSMASTIEELEQ